MKAVYIHIPFCNNICAYCDFNKLYYQSTWADNYLIKLKEEIENNYQGEAIKTLYVGGGTPSVLSLNQLDSLFEIIALLNLSEVEEFTIESNIEDLTLAKLKLFKEKGVNRLSLGVQTFTPHLLSFLGRKHTEKDVLNTLEMIKEVGFDNLNLDFMYGIPGQTLKDLNNDLNLLLTLEVTHLSFYHLIIEDNTKLKIDNIKEIDDSLSYQMFDYINKRLNKEGYHHYEISNYAKASYESKHNLTYWHNDPYYGFGLGAVSFDGKVRKENTKNFTKYLKGEYHPQEQILTTQELMENELILGLRMLEGINMNHFFDKYQQRIEDVFPIERLLREHNLEIKGDMLFIPKEKIFVANDILINFIN